MQWKSMVLSAVVLLLLCPTSFAKSYYEPEPKPPYTHEGFGKRKFTKEEKKRDIKPEPKIKKPRRELPKIHIRVLDEVTNEPGEDE